MSTSLRFRVLVFGTVLLLCSTAAAENIKAIRTDLYGDPLPRGAVARLGSARFRFSYSASHLTFSADGKKLLGGGYGGPTLWDSATGERLRKFNLGRFVSDGVVGFTSDGKVFALAKESSHYESLFLRLEFDSERSQLPSLGVNVEPLALSPDRKKMLFFDVTEVVLWDFVEQKRIKSFSIGDFSKSPLRPLLPNGTAALSPDSHIIAYYDTDIICLFDLRPQKTIRKWDVPPRQSRSGRCLAFSWDGKSLIAGGEFGIRVWDVASGRELSRFAEKGPFPGVPHEKWTAS